MLSSSSVGFSIDSSNVLLSSFDFTFTSPRDGFAFNVLTDVFIVYTLE